LANRYEGLVKKAKDKNRRKDRKDEDGEGP